MANQIPVEELQFLLHDWLGLSEVLSRPEFGGHSAETVDALLSLCDRLAAEHFAPHYRRLDVVEPYLDDTGVHVPPEVGTALRRYAELGLFAAGFPESLGGSGLPHLVSVATHAQFAAANLSIAGYSLLTVANARLIAAYGSAAQVEAFARPQIEGRWLGTMCLSEPQAGSSLADITTKAVPDAIDEIGRRYRLTGSKMWISAGDHDASENIVHLVLAKVRGADGRLPDGTKGISLFIVPKVLPDGEPNDVAVAGLNHKMGFRGTSNCLLNFGEREGAVGWLVGEEGQGLPQMFQMMNEARIGVGVGAAALGYAGYRHAAAYARERVQGRAAGAPAGSPPAPIIEHADVKHMLLAQKAYAEGGLALCLYSAKLVDDRQQPGAEALLGLLTPIAKTWPSEYGLAANDLAIQVHGGYGYTRDFPVEQLYRDNRLNAIHEGTTGIQALDLLGRKLLRSDSEGFDELVARMGATIAAAKPVDALAGFALRLEEALARTRSVIEDLRQAPGNALANATAGLRALGHLVVAWLWLDMNIAAARSPEPFRTAKFWACRYFFECELPKIDQWLQLLESRSDVASGAPAEIF